MRRLTATLLALVAATLGLLAPGAHGAAGLADIWLELPEGDDYFEGGPPAFGSGAFMGLLNAASGSAAFYGLDFYGIDLYSMVSARDERARGHTTTEFPHSHAARTGV